MTSRMGATERECEEEAQRQIDGDTVIIREPREMALEDFAMARAQEETKKGRAITLVVMEIDHKDGHVSNVVYGDLHLASKLCKHLSQDLAMRVLKQLAQDMGMSLDNGEQT